MAPVIIVHGPPNAGKSWQAKHLADRHAYAYVSSGDLLRAATDPDIKERLERGQLARSEDILRLMHEALTGFASNQVVVIDGFPRMIGEFHALRGWLEELGRPIQAVISIDISEAESLERGHKRGRIDDRKLDERWYWYKTETQQVVDYCQSQGILKRVDGVGTREVVAERIEAAL